MLARLQFRPGVVGQAVAPDVGEVLPAAVAAEHDHLAAQHDRAVGVPLLRRLRQANLRLRDIVA